VALPDEHGQGAVSVILTRLGVPWLWGADVEKGWVFMRFNVVPITTRLLAPGSYSYGLDRLPETGGAVLAVNHLSAIQSSNHSARSARLRIARAVRLPLPGDVGAASEPKPIPGCLASTAGLDSVASGRNFAYE
jgi:hypothetical protein